MPLARHQSRILVALTFASGGTAAAQTPSFTVPAAPAAPALTLPVAGGGSIRVEPGENGMLRIADVNRGQPSAPATTLAAGDLVVGPAMNGKVTLPELRDLVARLADGDSVALDVRRDVRTLVVYYRKPTAAELAQAGVVSIPAGAAMGAGGNWTTMRADPNARPGEMLEIAGNQIRPDEDSGQIKVMMKVRDPDMAAVGLKALDHVLEVNGEAVADMKALIAKYGAIATGDTVTLLVERGGAQVTLTFAKPALRR